MPDSTDPTSEAARGAPSDGVAKGDTASSDSPSLLRRVPRIGIWAWSFVGLVVAAAIVFAALGVVSEIVLPLTFAAVLAVIFKPLVGTLERRRVKPTLAAGLVVLGLLALMIGVVVGTVHGVVEQADEISAVTDKAVDELADQTDELGVDKAAWTRRGRQPRTRAR